MAKAKSNGVLLTTIALLPETKKHLDKIQMETGETYERIIKNLIIKSGNLMSRGYNIR